MRAAIDIGGTFTDVVLFDEKEGKIFSAKVHSDPKYPNKAFIGGLYNIQKHVNSSLEDIQELVHGTTIVTNTILEGKKACVGMLVTEGFRDILEIGRQQRHNLYDLRIERPPPLVPRHLIKEIKERVNSTGKILNPLDCGNTTRIIEKLIKSGVESLAVTLLFSFKNPTHERLIKSIAIKYLAQDHIFISSEISPEFREFERASTTVVAAAVAPQVIRYLSELEKELKQLFKSKIRFTIMHSGGGTILPRNAKEQPHKLVESGPAAGVIAAAQLANKLGIVRAISFDMGGTSAKAGLILDGTFQYTTEYEIGGGVHHSQGLKGCGYPVRFPMLDVAEVGAGAGSIAWTDPGGLLKVGPKSAGANPGPACYGKGGKNPTVTDAHLILGHLSPEYFLGGKQTLFPKLAKKVLINLSKIMNLTLEELAQGIISIININMLKVLELVSIDRGYDPRDFTLIAFGGAGPLHACDLAEKMSIKYVVIPLLPGVFSAWGLLFADMTTDFVETVMLTLDLKNTKKINQIINHLSHKANQFFEKNKIPLRNRSVKISLDLRYLRQNYELNIKYDKLEIFKQDLVEIKTKFTKIHESTYGHSFPDAIIQIVNIRILASNKVSKPKISKIRLASNTSEIAKCGTQNIWKSNEIKKYDTYRRNKLYAGHVIHGPAIIQEEQATTVINSGWQLQVDQYGNLIITKE